MTTPYNPRSGIGELHDLIDKFVPVREAALQEHYMKAAIASTRMKKLLHHYHEALSEDGASKISLQAYAAAGGWVGITYSYELSDGFTITGSQVPRRV